MRYYVESENNKGTTLNINKKFKSKLFHTSTTQKVLQHRVFNLSTWHSIKTIRDRKGEGNLHQAHLNVYRSTHSTNESMNLR